MFLRILKKDMKVRKSINFVLFLFIAIASVFLSSSVSNIAVVSSAIEYYMDYANTPDVMFITTKNEEKDEIRQWLKEEARTIEKSDYEELLTIGEADIYINKNGKQSAFESKGFSLVVGTQGNDYCRAYDQEGKEFDVDSGEIAFGKNLMEENDLKAGDKVTIRIGTVEKTFTIKLSVKDAVFGHEMSGTQRMMISSKDYEDFYQQESVSMFGLYYVETNDTAECIQEITDAGFETVNNVQTRDTYKLIYSMDMIMAALLILIGICLIFIAFLVLRFALVFTIEEDYREIGIMKAIGMKNFAIKKIYLTKYLFLVVTGAVLGLVVSIPVSGVMVDSVSQNMIMESSSANLWINILCTIAIILVVMIFCYRCTKKMNDISAIAAIRGGGTGERYGKRAGISLYKRRRMPVTVFLGVNDIASNIRRYLILLFTFCISFILITIPLNTLNTMRSREMVEKFDLNPDSVVYVSGIEVSGEQYHTSGELKKAVLRLENEMKQEGYEAMLTYCPIYFLQYGEKDSVSKVSIMTMQMLGDNTDFLKYDDGVAPQLENEIAFSKQILEMYDWKIGDTIEMSVNGTGKQMLITGTYTDYMQMGQSARLNPYLDCGEEVMFDYWKIMVDMKTEKTTEEIKAELSGKLPEYDWNTAQEVIDVNVGGIQQTLDSIVYPMTGFLCALIMLITILMEKLFIVREKGEIAMLKSIGYKTRDLRWWQVLRMVIVAFLSMLIAAPMSLLSNRLVLQPVFRIMGAEVEIQVDPWKVYVEFPAILFAGIIVAVIVATRGIRKTDIREMNQAE